MENYKLYIHEFPNGKAYVGITSQDVEARWRRGEGYKNQFVYKAILKYGWDEILHRVLISGMTKEEAEEKEMYYISALKTNRLEYGYNVANGGNCYGTHSEETKRKIAESNAKRVCTEETRRKIRQGNIGKTLTEEQKEKISKSLQGRAFTQEHRDRISAAKKGVSPTAETRRKISEAKIGQKFHCNNPGERGRKISDAMKNRNKEQPEIIAKMQSASVKKCSKQVIQKSIDGNTIAIWASAAEIERILGINHVQISRACRNEGKIVSGFLWSFV